MTDPIARPNTSRDRMPAQRWAEGGLAQHPYQLELKGSPNELSWPRVCAHCGEGAAEQIIVSKAFRPRPRRHRSGSSWMRPYRITSAPIPFCGSCAAEHRATVESPSTVSKLLNMLLNPLMIPVVGCIWLATVFYGGARGTSIRDPAGRLGWSLFALVVVGAVWSLFLVWQTTRASRLDPRTDITRACDFSEDVSQFFEKERRIYALRNKAFAEALAAANANRVWTEVEQSRSKTLSWIVALGLLVLLGGVVGVLALTGRL